MPQTEESCRAKGKVLNPATGRCRKRTQRRRSFRSQYRAQQRAILRKRNKCLEEFKHFDENTQRCIETERSCERKGMVLNERTKRCNKTRPRAQRTTRRAAPRQPTPPPEEDDDCPICMMPLQYQNRRNLFFGLNCDHVFHARCIKKWCFRRGYGDNNCQCPLCRTPLFLKNNLSQSPIVIS